MHDRAETSLAFYNDIRYTHLAAESGKEYNELNRINVVCDDNERGLLSFDEGDTVVQAIFDEEELFRVLLL